METRTIIRYTLGQLSELNHGKIGEIKLFSTYPEPVTSETYQNPHGARFHKSAPTVGKEPILKGAHIHSDQKVVEDIRKVISSITRERSRVDAAVERMNQLAIPTTQSANVAKLFHTSMIECDFLIDEYMSVMLNFKNTDIELMKNIYQKFVLSVIGEFLKPSNFEDSHAETGKNKSARWRIRNAVILAKLFNVKLAETPEFDYIRRTLRISDIVSKFLNPIFDNMKPTDNLTTQLVVAVWTVIRDGKKLQREAPDIYNGYLDQIKAIVSSDLYPATDKVRMMNLLEH